MCISHSHNSRLVAVILPQMFSSSRTETGKSAPIWDMLSCDKEKKHKTWKGQWLIKHPGCGIQLSAHISLAKQITWLGLKIEREVFREALLITWQWLRINVSPTGKREWIIKNIDHRQFHKDIRHSRSLNLLLPMCGTLNIGFYTIFHYGYTIPSQHICIPTSRNEEGEKRSTPPPFHLHPIDQNSYR